MKTSDTVLDTLRSELAAASVFEPATKYFVVLGIVLGTLPILVATWWCGDSLFADGLTIAFAAASIAANRFHAWAHATDVSRTVQWLQEHRLVLPPRHHARHHRGSYRSHYCMTTGWMNACTDGLGVFTALERALRALGMPATSA